LCVVGWLAAAAGCAGWKQHVKKPEVTEDREARADSAVRDFEQRRDGAQLSAALDRWKQGDAAGAETALTALIRRRPECLDARLRLAEILWSRGDIAAEPHLRAVLEAQPDRAEAHHSLGLLLDGSGRPDEARQHLTKAAELEPDNEIYRTTCESLPH
jgi:Flp pilus assembly protein TadD